MMMIPQCLRSPSRGNPKRSPTHFRSSSFKDIGSIIKEEEEETCLCPSSRKRPSIFHRVKLSTACLLRSWANRHAPPSPHPSIILPNADQRNVVYLTSLHVVRRTFEDCKTVRSILGGVRVQVDERDLSLDPSFLEELQGIIGRKSFSLPLVFIGGRYIGGAEEVKRLHECGELNKLVSGLPLAVGSGVCNLCQGMRFVVCRQCNGSHKIYSGKTGFRTCKDCNSNGLVWCPSCSPGGHRTVTSSFL